MKSYHPSAHITSFSESHRKNCMRSGLYAVRVSVLLFPPLSSRRNEKTCCSKVVCCVMGQSCGFCQVLQARNFRKTGSYNTTSLLKKSLVELYNKCPEMWFWLTLGDSAHLLPMR